MNGIFHERPSIRRGRPDPSTGIPRMTRWRIVHTENVRNWSLYRATSLLKRICEVSVRSRGWIDEPRYRRCELMDRSIPFPLSTEELFSSWDYQHNLLWPESRKTGPGRNRTHILKKNYRQICHCGTFNGADEVITMYFDGLSPTFRTIFARYRKDHLRTTYL